MRAYAAETRGAVPAGTSALRHCAGADLVDEATQLAAQWSRAHTLVDDATISAAARA